MAAASAIWPGVADARNVRSGEEMAVKLSARKGQ